MLRVTKYIIPKSEASFVLTAKLTFRVNSETDAHSSSMQDRDLDKKCTEISHFDFDIKTNIVII
jgi:hypothetical protein